MITTRLYEQDSYLKEFDATVVACDKVSEDEYQLVLDATAFFPEGGGQGADKGVVGDIPVLDVQIKNGVIYHKAAVPFEVGVRVHGAIDWENRFSNMQQHSGEHIFSGLVNRYYGYNNVGFHLGAQVMTMDFDGVLEANDIARLEEDVNRAIRENVAISVSYPTDEELENLSYRSKIEILDQVRIVTVEGYDVCACCAPHVALTGAIGGLKVVNFQKYKGGTRVTALCGLRALHDYQMKQKQAEQISKMLSVPVEQVADGVCRQQEEIVKLRQEIYRLTEELIDKELDDLVAGTQNKWFFKEQLEAPAMRKIVNRALEKVTGYCGVFVGNDADGYKYIIGSRDNDARNVAKIMQEHLGVRGGGSAQMVQGAAKAKKEDIQDVLEKYV